MDKKTLVAFNSTMQKAMLQAGQVAIDSQKGIKNIGKIPEKLPLDSPIYIKMRSAKTSIDENAQELLLSAAIEVIDPKLLQLDAEEDTESTHLFAKSAEITLIIDPIDGTFEYIQDKDCYSICVGLVYKGTIMSALVYFPSQKKFYFLDEEQKPFVSQDSLQTIKPLEVTVSNSKKQIYIIHRVPQSIKDSLTNAGYKLIDDLDDGIIWPYGILGCLSGKYQAAIFFNSQIRDILLGAIISQTQNGYALSWNGEKFVWPQAGRIQNVVFGIGDLPQEIQTNLSQN